MQHSGRVMVKLRRFGLEVIVPALVTATWWLLSAHSHSFYFPPLPRILKSFWHVWFSHLFVTDAVPSIMRLLVGYGVASIGGIVIGTAFGLSEVARRAAEPIVEFVRSIPPPALVPLAILVLGVGNEMKVWVIAIGSIWPVLLSTMAGVRALDGTKRQVAQVYQLRQRDRLRFVVLPGSAPQIMSGLRTGLSIAIILMVISEMVASTSGIGYFVLQAQRSFAISQMWAGIILLGLLGYVLNLAFTVLEHRLLHWYRYQQGVIKG